MLSIILFNTQLFIMYSSIKQNLFLLQIMKKNLNLNIFNKNINDSSKSVFFISKQNDIGPVKYLPPYFKEWKNTAYFFNKNEIKDMPINNININKLIKGYFNLFFKNYKYISSIKDQYTFLKQIYTSKAEIKYTNSIAIITLYTVNLRNILFKKLSNYYYYYNVQKEWEKQYKKGKQVWVRKSPISLGKALKKEYLQLAGYNTIIAKWHKIYSTKNLLNWNLNKFNNLKDILKYKFKYLDKNLNSYNLFRKIYLNKEIKYIYHKYLVLLYRYNHEYTFNNIKFKNKDIYSFTNKLSSIISNSINKKVVLNIINLKSIVYSPDIFTKALSLKLKKGKKFNVVKNMITILNKAKLPKQSIYLNELKLMNKNSYNSYLNKYKDLSLISNINKNNLDSLLKKIYSTNKFVSLSINTNNIKENYTKLYDTIFSSIKYKNMGGIRLEVKGRLTKRYRADRAIYKLFWKGSLKNLDFSTKKSSLTMFRGYLSSNLGYSMNSSKRRIGAFAVKGWTSGK